MRTRTSPMGVIIVFTRLMFLPTLKVKDGMPRSQAVHSQQQLEPGALSDFNRLPEALHQRKKQRALRGKRLLKRKKTSEKTSTWLALRNPPLQANNMAIAVASTRLVDQFAQQTATPGSDVRTLVQQNITNKLGALDGRSPKLPVGPVAEGQKGVIANLVLQLLQSQQGVLAAAIRAGAQARVNELKAQLSNRVANSVTNQLNRSFWFYDSWTDPLIGLRGRLNLSKAFYLTAETDVGGFGIGSDIAGDAYAALGCQITRYIYSEVGYRCLYDDFRDANDFLYQMTLHGAQLTVGITFQESR